MRQMLDRFSSKYTPEPNSGCWLWIGGVNEMGYGIFGVGEKTERVAKAHRVSYEIHKGPIPAGMNVLHRCDVPGCVNPDHLWLGTLRDNSRDMVNKGRGKTPDNRGERAGWAKLTEEMVVDIKSRRLPGRKFAILYGVSKSAVFNIWRGKSWRSV